MTTSALSEYLQQQLPLIQRELRAFLEAERARAAQSSTHLAESYDHILDFVFAGGKFMRGALVVVGYKLAGGTDMAAIVRAAAAVELFHKYILCVDDRADRDELRYGQPTLWKRYQQEFAAAGWSDAQHHGWTFSEIDSLLMASCVNELLRTSAFAPELVLRAQGLVHALMYQRTIAGWQIHYYQNHQTLADADEAEYLRGLEMVTAEYSFVAPLQIGATLAAATADDKLWAVLEKYGRLVGQAFQMQDDVIGMFGDPAETGKPVGNDFREGKKTLLLQRAYHSPQLSADDKTFLEKKCGSTVTPADMQRVQKIMTDTGALAQTQAQAEKLVEEAKQALVILIRHGGRARGSAVEGSSPSAELSFLTQLADFVIARKA